MKRSHRILWRWAERDFGFRFRDGVGKRTAEYYQAAAMGEFYSVPASHRKFEKTRVEELDLLMPAPTAPTIVANPWSNYSDTDPQRITGPSNQPCLNWAGCLSMEEINQRETNGVNRAKEFVADLALRDDAAPITLDLVRRVHEEMFADIYPWAGQWRSVSLHKGEGSTKWPLPITGMAPVMEAFSNEVLSRTPFLSEDDDAVIAFAAEFMGEYLALHPFREGNGRSAFVLCELILLQNNLLPLNEYNRQRDQARYFAACEEARVRKEYAPLAHLITDWEAEAQAAYEASIANHS